MKTKRTLFLQILWWLLVVAVLGAMFYQRAAQNSGDSAQSPGNFFTFWLPGHMVLNGQSPYDQTQYLAGHDEFNVTWRPNQIFPYPLPLSLLMVPLGMLPLATAFFVWQIVSQVIIGVTVYLLLGRGAPNTQKSMFLPLMIFLLFFGPVYLTLQLGTIGALALAIMAGALFLFQNEKSLAAGALLSLTILKPPQGLTILLLVGIWSLARKDWKAILGMALGGLGLLLVGMVQDPLWVVKFGSAGQAVMDRTLGIQSNVWSFAYLLCNGRSPCSPLLGGLAALTILGLGGLFLWRNQARLSAWEAFNVIIPLGFVSTIYLWEYDQLLYIIPIVWITCAILESWKSYLRAFLFLSAVELMAFAALLAQAYSNKKDLLSLGTTVIVLGMVLWLYSVREKRAVPAPQEQP
jgi:hypothetical protein